jgi:putative redox protein
MQQNLKFTNREGQTLAGVLHAPDVAPPRASAVFAHCFTCTKNIKAAVRIADALAGEGFAVLRFDFTGLGQSEGDFSETRFSSNVDDLVDAAEFMSGRDQPPALLIGHSLGGTAVLAAAHEIESVEAVATIAAPADPEHVLNLLDHKVEKIENEGSARAELGGQPVRISKAFIDDVRTRSVSDNLGSLRKALLVMHSPVDDIVSIDEAARIYRQALHPKSFVSLDDADHLLSRDRDARYAARVLAAWAGRYIKDEAVSPPQARFVENAAVVDGRRDDGFLVSINANGFPMLGDEPPGQGGSGRGPSPYNLLASALASCTVMTLNFFARREKIPLERAEATVRHERIHAEDCAECEKKSGRIEHFTRTISLRGDLDDSHRQLLLKIADRCPVHRTLENDAHISTTLEEDG